MCPCARPRRFALAAGRLRSRHHGAADSTPGQGSCFSFDLVLPPTDACEPTQAPAERPIVGLEPGQPACRVLIVDDLPDNRAPLRALLTGLNPQPPVLEVREAAAEVDTTTGSVVHAFTDGTMVQVFLLAEGISEDAWNGGSTLRGIG